ncbi:hypothetical protein PVAND_008823 [Polypedilum vanderplanki]|uniref:Chitin-binding type-2 domain-containing protein n=1 Tax=Polypedilum vanderplanki TaxID=319348 RepID=A0A9J6CBY2_POLVA|nr:hypothetical protein PVAND_008823 [Polypedilum vanderplanki]
MSFKKILLISVTLCAVLSCTLAVDSCSGGSIPHRGVVAHESNCKQYKLCIFGNLNTLDCPTSNPFFDACALACGKTETNCLTCNSGNVTSSTTSPPDSSTTEPNLTTTDLDTAIPTESTISEQTSTGTTSEGQTSSATDSTTAPSSTTSAVTTSATVPTAPIVPPTPPQNP